jgi:hypothetical protein
MAIPPVPTSPSPGWGPPPKELMSLLEHAIKAARDWGEAMKAGNWQAARNAFIRLKGFVSRLSPADLQKLIPYMRAALTELGVMLEAAEVAAFIEGISIIACFAVVCLVFAHATAAPAIAEESPRKLIERMPANLRNSPQFNPVVEINQTVPVAFARLRAKKQKECACRHKKVSQSALGGPIEGRMLASLPVGPGPGMSSPGGHGPGASGGPQGTGAPSGGRPRPGFDPMQFPRPGGTPLPPPGKTGPQGPTLPDRPPSTCSWPLCELLEGGSAAPA